MPILVGGRSKRGKSENQKIMDRIMGENNKRNNPQPKTQKKSKKKGY